MICFQWQILILSWSINKYIYRSFKTRAVVCHVCYRAIKVCSLSFNMGSKQWQNQCIFIKPQYKTWFGHYLPCQCSSASSPCFASLVGVTHCTAAAGDWSANVNLKKVAWMFCNVCVGSNFSGCLIANTQNSVKLQLKNYYFFLAILSLSLVSNSHNQWEKTLKEAGIESSTACI